MDKRIVCIGLLAATVLSGCSLFMSYPQKGGISNGDGAVDYVVTDAKQRLVSYMEPGRVDGGRVTPKRLVCAEPSPDVASAFQFAMDVALKQSSGNSVGGSVSFAESIMQLGKRIATVQLLRDELSDLCRSYANGAVSSATYTIRLSRLDKKMVTLLSSEAAAGAITESAKALVGTAQANGAATSAEVAAKRDEVTKDIETVKTAKANLDKGNNDTAELKKAIEKLDKDNAELTEAMAKNAHAVLSAGATLQTTQNETPATRSPQIIEEIQENYLRVDDASTIMDACLTAMTEDSLQKQLANILAATAKIEDEIKKTDGNDERKRRLESRRDDLLTQRQQIETEIKLDYEEGRKSLANVSSMTGYCAKYAMPKIHDLMSEQAKYKHVLEMAKVNSKNTKTEHQIILNCQQAILDAATPQDMKDICKTYLASKPQPAADAAIDDFSAATASIKGSNVKLKKAMDDMVLAAMADNQLKDKLPALGLDAVTEPATNLPDATIASCLKKISAYSADETIKTIKADTGKNTESGKNVLRTEASLYRAKKQEIVSAAKALAEDYRVKTQQTLASWQRSFWQAQTDPGKAPGLKSALAILPPLGDPAKLDELCK